MTLTATWSYPTAIRFGAGRIAELAQACRDAGITRPLLVTDRGLAGQAITAQALDLLEAAGLGRAIFAEVDANPNDQNAAQGVRARQCHHQHANPREKDHLSPQDPALSRDL